MRRLDGLLSSPRPAFRRLVGGFLASTAVLAAQAGGIGLDDAPAPIPLLTPDATKSVARLPLAFEPAPPGSAPWRFAARGDGYLIGLAGHETLLMLRERPASLRGETTRAARWSHAVRLQLEGARTDAPWTTEEPLPGRVHRLLGNDPRAWEHGLATVGRVRWHEVYPGIDAVYRGHGRQLEYDFIVAPGADPGRVRLRFDGATVAGVDADGSLRLAAGGRELRQHGPVAWQDLPAGRRPVTAEYVVADDGTVGLALGDYDPGHTLVIDPVLSYETFLGSTGNDQVWDLAVADAEGALIIVGETESFSFPTNIFPRNGVLQTNYAGGVSGAGGDAFVARLNAAGTAYDWFTYLGGSDIDAAYSVAVDGDGTIVLGGFTASTNFPVIAGALQPRIGGVAIPNTPRYQLDGFVARLAADGSRLNASTYYGGALSDQIIQLRLAPDGDLAVAGQTTSLDLPVPANAAQRTNGGGANDAFVARLSHDLSALVGASYFGGPASESAEGLALAADGTMLITGYTGSFTNFPLRLPLQATNAGGFDSMLARFDARLTSLLFSTYLGGANDDFAYRIVARPDGRVTIAGETFSTNYPVTPGAFQSTNRSGLDGFLTTFTADLTALAWSTYYGGNADDAVWSLAADADNRLVAGLATGSSNIAGVTTNSIQSLLGGDYDALLARFSPSGALEYATFYGGAGEEIPYGLTLDAAGNAYVGGRTRSIDLLISTNAPQVNYGGGQTDGFVFKVSFEPVLAAEAVDGGVEVSWPAPNPNFALQRGVLPGQTFQPVTNPPAIGGGRHQVTLPADGEGAAFRLGPK
ncbi:MAG: hypothetical protein ACKVYV_05140 [Limisphaerales bacterium]